MIFVALVFTCAFFAYAVYNVVDPTAAHEFWVCNITRGWRFPWIHADDAEYIWAMRVWGVIAVLFSGFGIFALVSAAIGGQR